MALPVNIDDLVNHRKVEWARIEYKEGWNPEKVLHTLCAFANDIDNWGGGYVMNASRDYFTFVLPVHKYFLQSNAKTVHELNGTDPVTLSSTVPVPYQYRTSTVPVTDPVPAPVRKLLSALKNGPLSPAELRTVVGVQHRQTFRENYLNPAIRADLICAEDGLSPHDPRIRYALTDKGISVLNEVAETLHQTEKVAPQRKKVALEIAPEESRHILSGSQGTGHVVSVVPAEEELLHIKVALEKYMVQKSVQTSDKLLHRRAKIIQYILRNKQVTIYDLTEALAASIRTLKSDVAVLRKIGALKHIGANKNGSWVVLLDFKGKLFAPPKSDGSRQPHSRKANMV